MCKFKITWISLLWGPICPMLTDGRTDMTKPIVALRNFAKAPKKGHITQPIQNFWPVHEHWGSTYIVRNDLSVYRHLHTDVGAQPAVYRSSDLGINLQEFQPGFLSQCSAKFVTALSCGATVNELSCGATVNALSCGSTVNVLSCGSTAPASSLRGN